MTTKISIYVDVPAVGRKMNFLVPENMSINQAIRLMVHIIVEEYQGIQCDLKELKLVNLKDNTVLNQGCSCKQLGVTNGSNLILL